YKTIASGDSSHAEGGGTIASGSYSHAQNEGTIAQGKSQTAIGRYNVAQGTSNSYVDTDNAFIIGNGTDSSRSNALEVKWNGDTWVSGSGDFAGDISVGGDGHFTGNVYAAGFNPDFAEMFETIDGNPIDVGYCVALVGDKIRKANSKDEYILGITSATPAIIADGGEMRWKYKYVIDEWGRVQYEDVVVPAEKDKDGKVIIPKRTETRPILNPEYDNTKEYIPRSKRPEWVAVGLIGQLLVRDDGTCKVNGYCMPNDEGIATASSTGYRVMERTGENQILVLVK
ncbi:peptidase G2 autoproteolytic cleavage domain-containing protein, partial [Anaeromicrobium sediminis]